MVRCIETELERQEYEEAPVDINRWPITIKLILDCINEQLPSGEEGKVFKKVFIILLPSHLHHQANDSHSLKQSFMSFQYARMVKVNIRTVPHLKIEYKCKFH